MTLTALFLVWLQMSAHQPKLVCGGNPLPVPCARAADETDGTPVVRKGESYQCGLNPGLGGPKFCVAEKDIYAPKAEPVDVPAVQVGSHLGFEGCGTAICIDHPVADYSCKDKSRILEHDENSPPRYWCRKVQP